jgi:serine/threonine-protein kinase HipA
MNGVLIGRLEKLKQGGLVFNYEENWIKTPGARPISLSLPLVDTSFSGELVYNFFDNLLPDNPQIRARIQSKFKIPTNHPFDLLANIGKDCVGAIQIVEEDADKFEKKIKFEIIDEKKIATILRGYQKNPLGMSDETETFRISIAGAQEKTAFLHHYNKWAIPLNDTPTSHIFKLPIGFIAHQQLDLTDSCENEWLCLLIAEAFGLSVAKTKIVHFEEIKVLVVERFDRQWSSDSTWLMRLPQEDMCQALGLSSNLKYQADGGPGIKEIMRLLLGSSNSKNDRDFFYRAQILFWLLAAIDGHAKNFSIFIEPEGRFSCTPLYDVMSAYPLIKNKQLQSQKIKMAMALRGKNNHYHWHLAQRRHFSETAKFVNYSVKRAEQILDEMLDQIDFVIQTVSEKLPPAFPQKISGPIFEGLQLAKNKFGPRAGGAIVWL